MAFPRELYDALADSIGKDVVDGKIRNLLTRLKKKAESGEAPKLNELEVARDVIRFFNQETGGAISEKSATALRLIRCRLKDGYSAEDLKHVVSYKNKHWKGNSEMKGFIRPLTLFGTKFEGYLSEYSRWEQGRSRTCTDRQGQHPTVSNGTPLQEGNKLDWRYETNLERFERIQRERAEGKDPNPSALKIDKKTGKVIKEDMDGSRTI